jgi:hypothetical protein
MSTLMPREGRRCQAPTSSRGIPPPLCGNLYRTGHRGHPAALGSSELRRSVRGSLGSCGGCNAHVGEADGRDHPSSILAVRCRC